MKKESKRKVNVIMKRVVSKFLLMSLLLTGALNNFSAISMADNTSNIISNREFVEGDIEEDKDIDNNLDDITDEDIVNEDVSKDDILEEEKEVDVEENNTSNKDVIKDAIKEEDEHKQDEEEDVVQEEDRVQTFGYINGEFDVISERESEGKEKILRSNSKTDLRAKTKAEVVDKLMYGETVPLNKVNDYILENLSNGVYAFDLLVTKEDAKKINPLRLTHRIRGTYYEAILDKVNYKKWVLNNGKGHYLYQIDFYTLYADGKYDGEAITLSTLEDIVKIIIPKNATNREKVKIINNWIVENIRYKSDPNARISQHSILRTLTHRNGVCQVYASTFQVMAEFAGLRSVYAVGNVHGNELHAWNYVYIDGKWLGVDTTWNGSDKNYKNNNWEEYLMLRIIGNKFKKNRSVHPLKEIRVMDANVKKAPITKRL